MTLKGRSKVAKARKERFNRDVAFFREQAGYSYDPKTETPGQGRQRCAEQLAQAKEWAFNHGWRYYWFADPDGCIGGDCGEMETCNHPCCHGTEHTVLCCQLWSAEHKLLASLGSICEPDANYKRVVEAELALEAMPK